MTQGSADLQKFYTTPLGQAAAHQVQVCLQGIWPDLTGQNLMGMGYALPYLNFYSNPSCPVFSLVPSALDTNKWPHSGLCHMALTESESFPLADESLDNILMIHALEYTRHPQLMLREAWRVLKGNGRLMVVVPNRHSLWAYLGTTPYGHGQPYTMTQLVTRLADNLFTPVNFKRTLYMVPCHSHWVAACQPLLDTIGPKVLQKVSGVVCVESIKQVYAGTHVPMGKPRIVSTLAPHQG